MCGIAGIVAFTDKGRERFRQMPFAIRSLKRRGPDGDGIFKHGMVCLGHTRLSIIDLSSLGAQPMTDVSGRYTISFNGEFYNYAERRSRLEAKGHSFRSGTDTEVLLGLYAQYGTAMFEHVNGFFAFAMHDKETGDVLIARDRIGIKPLYYYADDDVLLFASELKALMTLGIPKELDETALSIYFQTGYIPAPYSIFRQVKKLEPGHYLHVQNGKIADKAYYRIPVPGETEISGDSYETARRKVHDLIMDSVRLRMISDVPLGAFLSGGIDSSVIVAAASQMTDRLHTFSIGFKDQPYFDETEYALLVAKKFRTEHTVFSLTQDDLFGNLQKVLDYTDEPFADSSAIAVNILSMHTRNKVTVALSGDGGDELFAGYNKHHAEYMARYGGWKTALLRNFPNVWTFLPGSRSSAWGNRFRQLGRFSEGVKLSPAERYWRWAAVTGKNEADSLLLRKTDAEKYNLVREKWLAHFMHEGDLNQVLYGDMNLVLPNDMLYKVDMMSMENSLEVRVPLLDYRLVDYVFSLPSSYKIDRNRKKKLLVDSFGEMLPAELLNRPKKGFEVPMLQWLRTGLQPLLKELTSLQRVSDQGIFDPKAIDKLQVQLFSSNPGDVHFRLWSLIVFQNWWRNYME